MLGRAQQALGPDPLSDFEARYTGQYYALEQGKRPQDSVQTAGRTYRWLVDVDGGRVLRDAQQLFPGGILFNNRAVTSADRGFSVDLGRWRTGTDLQRVEGRAASGLLAQFERMFPALILRQASKAAAGVSAGSETSFKFVDPAGDQIEVHLDAATGLPVRASQTRAGVVQSEVIYGDYVQAAGRMTPRTVQVRVGGQLQEDVRLVSMTAVTATEESFQVPTGYAAPPAAVEPTLRELSDGLFMFEGLPGGYRSAVVDAGDHLVLLEAPLNPAYGEAQKRLVDAAFPGKAVRQVLVTHAHGDHTGGLKPWIEAGATVLAAKGAGVAIRRQAVARGVSAAIKIEEVEGGRRIGSAATPIDLQAFVGAHADANLVAHIPGARAIFQGDLFYVPERGAVPPAFEVSRELDALLRKNRWRVDWIIGVHGRPATPAELQQSLALVRRSAPVASASLRAER